MTTFTTISLPVSSIILVRESTIVTSGHRLSKKKSFLTSGCHLNDNNNCNKVPSDHVRNSTFDVCSAKRINSGLLKSISSTFYEQLMRQYFCAKKLQSPTVIREKQRKALLYKKGLSKMLMKLTPVVNFIDILWATFAVIFLHQKITKPNCN